MTPTKTPPDLPGPVCGDVAVSLRAVYVYPVKSLAGIAVNGAALNTSGGLDGDREWVIVKASGEVTWQGALPQLALVQPALERETLTLTMPGQAPLTVMRRGPRAGCRVQLWNDEAGKAETFSGEDAGDGAAVWLTRALGQTLRLVRLGTAARRRDHRPLHVLSVASVQALNDELGHRGRTAVEVERFRPNLLIETSEPVPFLEEQGAALIWDGGAQVQLEAPCVRCVMPNIDLRDARVGREPLATLVRMSAERHPGAPVRFGRYGRAVAGDRLERGQTGRATWATRPGTFSTPTVGTDIPAPGLQNWNGTDPGG